MKTLKNGLGAVVLCVALAMGGQASGQTLKTLFNFGQPPSNPYGGLAAGPDGNFYGTTEFGGTYGVGCVYRLTPGGALTDLVDFNNANGAYPNVGLVSDGHGNFYGNTQYGGVPGYGTIFRVTTNGGLTTLTNLSPAMGANPQAPLVWGADGKLYGTTYNGGSNQYGTIFQITTNGLYTVLASFAYTNGAHPMASVLLAADGNIYGTTRMGGGGLGAVYCLSPSGALTALGSFDFLYNGAYPLSSLVEDGAGNLYGTASIGGGGGGGNGELFEVPATNHQVIIGVATLGDTPQTGLVPGPSNIFYGATFNSLYTFNVTNGAVRTLFSFNFGITGGSLYAAPTVGTDGNLYGTAVWGGASGFGTVYQVTTNGIGSALYSFTTSAGADPMGGLIQGADGTIYGTAMEGGSSENGTIFSLATNGVITNILTFASSNGAYPYSGLVVGADGLLYTTAKLGGGNGGADGVIVGVSTNGQVYTNPVTFYSTNGASPVGGLVRDATGNFYGTTYYGGTYNYGTVFKLDTNQVLTTLAIFDATNGAWPDCTLVLDSAGYLWGTTQGGTGAAQYGTIFRVPSGGVVNPLITPLARFAGTNASVPLCGLAPGPDGAYYGTTEFGGKYDYGTVYRVTTNGVITPIFSFNGRNGAYPLAALAGGTNGIFYGTTSECNGNEYAGYGTVFRITTNGTLNTFVVFDGTNGSTPAGPVMIGRDGALYGTTQYGGTSGSGTIFRLALGPITPTPLAIQPLPKGAVLSWTNPVFNLQAGPALIGPFTNIPGAFSPYTNAVSMPSGFFRLEVDTN